MTENERLQELIIAVQSSAKYRQVSAEVIEQIGARELGARRNLKEAIKATKNKLHQVGAAYFVRRARYDRWLVELREAIRTGKEAELRVACTAIMHYHASTHERLPILEEFYATTLEEVAPVHSVLDIACGLDPLAIPWMPLAQDATYYAYDMYVDLMAFLSDFMDMIGVSGGARACDVTHLSSVPEADVAYLLKTLPCLEQLDKSAGARLLDRIPAKHLLISFPIRSLGGRRKGMLSHYEAHFYKLIEGKPWKVQQFNFDTELAFLVSK